MKKLWIIIIAVVALIIVGLSWYIGGLNRVVRMQEAVGEAWAQVETVLQRRYDLIPNLVNTVKGYARQEREVFTKVTELRSQWGKAKTVGEKIDTSRALDSAISRLLLVVENYPQLKSNQNFLALQDQLEGTENRIAVQRMRYNRVAKDFNAYIRSVFGSFFARKRGITEKAPYFEVADEAAKEAPKVEF